MDCQRMPMIPTLPSRLPGRTARDDRQAAAHCHGLTAAARLDDPTAAARPRAGAVRAGALAALTAALTATVLTGCGGGNPLSNPPEVSNPPGTTTQTLSFAYFQRCINPIFLAQLQITLNGVRSTNTCAAAGCHDNTSGTGGAFRVIGAAQTVDTTNAANTADVIRATDMYKNFYSAQAEVSFGSPAQSRLLTKPRVFNVLHGGGLIFETDQDPNLKLIQYWINRPLPQGQDEFSASANTMFTPPDPINGACNTQ
jgi:predicted small lipoprotein YifL